MSGTGGVREQGREAAAGDPGGRSFERRWAVAVADELAAEAPAPGRQLGEADLDGLPGPVRRYVVATGAVGRPIPRNVRVEMDAVMRRNPGDAGFSAGTIQVNGFARPARLFLMRARMFGLPVRALHLYRGDEATFQVRAAGLITVVDHAGEQISRSETVTVLNDLCAFAPGALVDPRLTWRAIDERSAAVTFRNGRWSVEATLLFDGQDRLVDFWSDDRPESVGRGFVPRRWSTPLSDHRELGGLRLPGRGLAVYSRPDGSFTYGEFTVRSVANDVTRA